MSSTDKNCLRACLVSARERQALQDWRTLFHCLIKISYSISGESNYTLDFLFNYSLGAEEVSIYPNLELLTHLYT